MHTEKTNYYLILRPCLWFAKNDKVACDKFQEYFTSQAIRSLIEDKFIEIHM